jgi:hypothetical protein
MSKKKAYLLPAATILMLGLTACGGAKDAATGSAPEEAPPREAGDFKVKELKVDAGPDNTSGVTPTVSTFTTEDGKLGIRVNGIDIGDGVQTPVISNMKIEPVNESASSARMAAREAAAPSVSDAVCKSIETGASGSGDKFDIVVSLDTTGSMGAQAGKLAEKIVDFAAKLEEQKLDVRFAGITVGDAFATLKASGSSYASDGVAKGSLGAPPTFDSSERPDTGLALITANDMQSFFTEVKNKVGGGLGGGDSPENYLGPIDYFNKNIDFRKDAGRFYIAIGDECAHKSGSSSNIDGTVWEPRSAELIKESLIKDGAAVHLIWADRSCSTSYYDMRDLQKATGGSWTNLYDTTFDLTKLPAIEAIGAKRKTLECEVTVAGSVKVTFTISVGDGVGKHTWDVTAIL